MLEQGDARIMLERDVQGLCGIEREDQRHGQNQRENQPQPVGRGSHSQLIEAERAHVIRLTLDVGIIPAFTDFAIPALQRHSGAEASVNNEV